MIRVLHCGALATGSEGPAQSRVRSVRSSPGSGLAQAFASGEKRSGEASTSSERMRFSFPNDLNAWEQGVLRPAVIVHEGFS